MLLEPVDPDETPADLRERYAEGLADALEAAGRAVAEAETDLDGWVLDAIEAGDAGALEEVELGQATVILGAAADRNPDALETEVRDDLMLSMTSAVLDVERLTVQMGTDLDPKEVQAKLEGRLPMTLDEYASLRAALAE